MRLMVGLLSVVLAGCGDREVEPLDATPDAPSRALVAVPPSPAPEVAVVSVVMDVMKVVGRSEDAVSGLLGPPVSCEDIHRARLCTYPPDGNEVMFVAGKADMITVRNMGAVAFDEDALAALGLGSARPDESSERAIRWMSMPDLEEVTVFAGDGQYVRYAYVKVGKH